MPAPEPSGLDEVRAGNVRPGKGLQPHVGLVGEELVDCRGLAGPVGDGVLVEDHHAAPGDLVPQRLQDGARRLVEVAIEVHEREAHAGIVVGEAGDRVLDVAVDQLDARLERNETIGIEDGDRIEDFLVKAGRVEAADRLAGVGIQLAGAVPSQYPHSPDHSCEWHNQRHLYHRNLWP